ncbi:MAG: hypothetical protein ACJ8EA_26815, partial [Xanthobacteraceae bacterium]
MRVFRHLAGGLGSLLLAALPARADPPLRLIPAQADLLAEVKQPRRLVETLLNLDLVRQLQEFPPVQEQLRSTRARRFYQLLAYFEKELGRPWPELLDGLAGGGVALGLVFQSLHEDNKQFGITPTASLLVIQGKDEKLMRKFVRLGLEVFEQELARQDLLKERPVKAPYQGVETIRAGKDLHIAVAGAALLVSNTEKGLQFGLDLHLGREKKSIAGVAALGEAAKLLPPDCLARVWLNMETVRRGPGVKDLYKARPRANGGLTVLAGGLLDVLGRAPYVCAGLHRDRDGFLATVRVPRGREGMAEPERALHLPPPGQPGTRPLLTPKGTLFTDSFYLDVSRVWQDRARLFPAKQVTDFEDFDKKTAPFLAGTRLSKLLSRAGPYHRIVVVTHRKTAYKTEPRQHIPAFAYVLELREPEAFGRSMEAVLRGAALLLTFQVKLELVEETHNGCKIVGYRFPEGAALKGDINDVRFNFSPCFVRVGNQFVWCSTVELCRELVDLLRKEDRGAGGDLATARARVPSTGAAEALQRLRDPLIIQVILDQAVSPKEA